MVKVNVEVMFVYFKFEYSVTLMLALRRLWQEHLFEF